MALFNFEGARLLYPQLIPFDARGEITLNCQKPVSNLLIMLWVQKLLLLW